MKIYRKKYFLKQKRLNESIKMNVNLYAKCFNMFTVISLNKR